MLIPPHCLFLNERKDLVMELKISPFLHIIPTDENNVAFYNSLNLEVVFLKKDFIEALEQDGIFHADDEETKKALYSLKELGFLIEKDSDGLDLFRGYSKALEDPTINILYLLLSDACNIRCRYCYFLANMPKGYKFSMMKEGTALAAIDMFARCVEKSVSKGHNDQHIILYGGEPTLNKPVVIEALKHIDVLKECGRLPKNVSITINTNGILLDKEILNQCKKSGVTVAISIDGPKEIHDSMRVYPSGEGTFDEVVESYRLAQEMGVKIGICVTVDRHNIHHMKEIVHWINKVLGAKGLGFNILIENDPNEISDDKSNYAEVIANNLIESFKIARDIGIYEDRMMRRVKNFVEKTPVLSDCGGCGLQTVVSPDGKIGVCQAFCGQKEFFVSESLETFEPESHPFWKQWRKRSPFSNEVCRACIAFGNCGGGCPYNAYRISGDLNALDERFCVHAKTATEFLIRDLWEQQNALDNQNNKGG